MPQRTASVLLLPVLGMVWHGYCIGLLQGVWYTHDAQAAHWLGLCQAYIGRNNAFICHFQHTSDLTGGLRGVCLLQIHQSLSGWGFAQPVSTKTSNQAHS